MLQNLHIFNYTIIPHEWCIYIKIFLSNINFFNDKENPDIFICKQCNLSGDGRIFCIQFCIIFTCIYTFVAINN